MGPGPRERALSETTDAKVRGAWKHVPSNLLEPSLWGRVYSGRVLNSDAPILLKEAEVALVAAKHLVRSGWTE